MNTGRALLLIAMLAALLSAAGCGSSGGDEVTVQTGSLSKAEFIKKADAICEASRTELITKFWSFLKAHQAAANSENARTKEALTVEIVNSVLTPNVEGEIKRISELGAPDDYASEVALFLNTLQERLGKVHENPATMSASATPFKQAGDAAKQAGMNGCAASLS